MSMISSIEESNRMPFTPNPSPALLSPSEKAPITTPGYVCDVCSILEGCGNMKGGSSPSRLYSGDTFFRSRSVATRRRRSESSGLFILALLDPCFVLGLCRFRSFSPGRVGLVRDPGES
jgi:hypothetical protein